jgi:type VII secretion integral membrane protein EccD
MAAAGVRDGEVLHLMPARAEWPEPEYDDVVDAVAMRARLLGARWSGDATRVAAVAAAGLVLAAGLVTPVGTALAGDRWAALGVAVALLVAGVLAARAYREPLVGVALAAYSLPPAFLGGWHLLGAGPPGAAPLTEPDRFGPEPLTPSHLLVATTALTLWAVAAALGVGSGLWIFVAGAAAGTLGSVAALAATVTDAARAAAVLLVVVVIGGTLAPSLAIRLGRLPLPVVALPPGASDASALAPRPDRARMLAAVERSDAMLTGLLLGLVTAGVGAGWVLRGAGLDGLLLTLVAGVALALRARLFVTVRQRTPLLAGGTVLGLLPFASGAWDLGRLAAPALTVAVVGLALAGARYRTRAPSPYLGRAADIADTLCLVSVIPIAAAVLDLYTRMRGLSG